MAEWGKWLVVIGGIIAVVGQWWGGPASDPDLYLPVVGGVLAVIGAFVQ